MYRGLKADRAGRPVAGALARSSPPSTLALHSALGLARAARRSTHKERKCETDSALTLRGTGLLSGFYRAQPGQWERCYSACARDCQEPDANTTSTIRTTKLNGLH